MGGATNNPQSQQAVHEDDLEERDEGKPGKNFAKIAKSAGARYGSKEAGERVAGAVRAKLAKQGKLEEVDMGQAEQGMRRSTPHTGGYNVVDKAGKVISTHKGHRDAMQAALNNDDYSVKAIKEGAKVDRMVKHIEKSERKLGKPKDKAEDIAWATANKRGMLDNTNKKKVKEGDIPSSSGVDTKGAGLGGGRSMTTLEAKGNKEVACPSCEGDGVGRYGKGACSFCDGSGVIHSRDLKNAKSTKSYLDKQKTTEGKKPDFLDLDKDGNKKEPMKKAAADKKKKQKVKESMNHRISAARLEGKSHGLKGHSHCGKNYADLDEARAYHEGYKDGLDECYGQGVYEASLGMSPATVSGMASGGLTDEGNAFTAGLARTPRGGKFSVGGKTFTDRTSYDAPMHEGDYAFESWNKQLNTLVNEGLSVSVSKGNNDAEDSVNINATGPESEQLMAVVRNAGLGLFGDEEEPASTPMSVAPGGEPEEVGTGGSGIEVVDGGDDMLSLMQKLSGVESPEHGNADEDYADEDYADEEGHDEACQDCGMTETECRCGEEQVDEVESEDQQEFNVAESDDDEEEDDELEESFTFESLYKKLDLIAESAKEDEKPAAKKAKEKPVAKKEEEESEDLTEWANNAGPDKTVSDTTFVQDINFMTQVISGGLNKPKSTGQTTVPIIAGQENRTYNGPTDWATLAGIKKA